MKGVEEIEHTLHNLASPKRGYTFWGFVLFCAVAALLLWAAHRSWLGSPNEVMLSGSEQGFKGYVTAAWHVLHDSTYVHYGGMAYPFGDHVLFADNQPMLSGLMRWWHRHVSDLGHNTVGALNLALMFSIVLGIGVIYLLLRKLHLPVWYAGLAATGIGFLSPQHLRLDGQFSLSHVWVLPMLLLLLCRYEERRSRRYQSLMIGVLLWFSAQLHFYYFGLGAAFLGFYTLFQLFVKRKWKTTWKRVSHLAAMLLVPFAMLNVWVHWSDYASDRPSAPYLADHYVGHWQGVFLPGAGLPAHGWFGGLFASPEGLHAEAQSYIGLAALAFVCWLAFARRFQIFDKNWDAAAYHRVHKYYLRGIAFAGFATLLLSLGVPFAIVGLEWSADYLGPFRQFRGLGRFAWAFYYVFNVLAFYFFWKKSQTLRLEGKWAAQLRSRFALFDHYAPMALRWSLALLPLAVVGWEAFFFQKNLPLKPVPNLFGQEAPRWHQTLKKGGFQAIMPLPYYHVGSENIWLEPSFSLFQKVQLAALQTGLPDMGAHMSRTSVGKMAKSVQWAMLPLETPALLAELPDSRPVALVVETGEWGSVQERYPHFVEKAQTIYSDSSVRVLSLLPDSLRAYADQWAARTAEEVAKEGKVSLGSGWRANGPGGWMAYAGFDSLSASLHHFQGSGAGQARLSDTVWLWQQPMPSGEFVLSIWLKVDQDMGMTQELSIWEGSGKRLGAEPLRFHLRSIVQGWGLFEVPFGIAGSQQPVRIFMHKPKDNRLFWYDEMLIREKKLTVYRSAPDWAVRNNYWHKLPPK